MTSDKLSAKRDLWVILAITVVLAVLLTTLANRGALGWFGTQGNGWLLLRAAVAAAAAWGLVKAWRLMRRSTSRSH
jgi:hypothetical protein